MHTVQQKYPGKIPVQNFISSARTAEMLFCQELPVMKTGFITKTHRRKCNQWNGIIITIITISCYASKNSKCTSPVKVMASVFWDSEDKVSRILGRRCHKQFEVLCAYIKSVKTTNFKGFAKYYDESSPPA